MGKRSNFERVEKDFYETPFEGVIPLLPHIYHIKKFAEPCVGKGKLLNYLTTVTRYASWSSDSEIDARTYNYPVDNFNCFITNPPWTREILHPIIENLKRQAPTWLLFDADWMHTKQSKELIKYCQKIVSVGRLKWIPNSPSVGKDNCCWYLFRNRPVQTEFYGR